MQNAKEVLQEIDTNMAALRQDTANQMLAFGNLSKAVKSAGALNEKTKELIGLALAVASHCHWCITIHTKNALRQGATKQEILEAGWVAVQMGGGPSLMYLQVVQKALEDLST